MIFAGHSDRNASMIDARGARGRPYRRDNRSGQQHDCGAENRQDTGHYDRPARFSIPPVRTEARVSASRS